MMHNYLSYYVHIKPSYIILPLLFRITTNNGIFLMITTHFFRQLTKNNIFTLLNTTIHNHVDTFEIMF